MAASSITSTKKLNDGTSIPYFGLGVYQSVPGEETYQAVRDALEQGYRHIDTAALYANEESVGKAVRDSGIPREEIFITTKFWSPNGHGRQKVKEALDASLQKLGMDYVDLYLIHSPASPKGREDSWKGMEDAKKARLARSIGVSNYGVKHLEALLGNCEIAPSTNQVEISPFLPRNDIVSFCHEKGIVVEAYSPLTRGEKLQDERLKAVASKYKKTPAQILIRYAMDRDLIVIPKSVHKKRIVENSEVFDFALSEGDLATMRNWDEHFVAGWDPTVQE